MIADRSPLRTVSSIGEMFSESPDQISHYSRDGLLNVLKQRDRTIDSLNLVIQDFSVIRKKDVAIVNIDSDKLNVRSKPSIQSEVLFQIPDSSLVNILLFDSETYVVGGESGSWCKIEFNSEVGWVWGNYLKKAKAIN
jgi:uncharacterized protein YraI